MSGGIKKWFMLQMWRVQQIAQILTLVMLAITNALLVYSFMEWREGSFFSTPYVGVPFLLLAIGVTIWIVAFFWDMRLKMWREQMTVAAEKNPFTKEKLTPKEIMIYGTIWLPLMERLGEDDPKIRESVESIRRWLLRTMKEDRVTEREVDILREYISGSEKRPLDPEK